MKLHWGHNIAVFYTLFVAVLVIVVIQSTRFDNSLVAEDYYARDINYQQEYDRRVNSEALEEGPRLTEVETGYRLEFPPRLSASTAGTLQLYRPSSKDHDRLIDIDLDVRGGMDLSATGLLPGRYRIILEWSAGGVSYLDEFDIYI